MTWREFVAEVEKQMRKCGIPDTVEISWLDISYPRVGFIDVRYYKKDGTVIIS